MTIIENKIVLTFDVEDWFNVKNMINVIPRKNWDQQELRIHKGMDFILDELHERNIKATFFIVGWIAQKCPQLVERICRDGHEVGSHSFWHRPIDLLTPEEFRQDLLLSISVLEKITSQKINGFRSPSFSVTEKTWWALEIIKDAHLIYDSSIFLIRHPDYGIPHYAHKNHHEVIPGLIELPIRNFEWKNLSLPIAGGGYFRLLPYWMTKKALKKELKNNYFIMYFHPWEFDPHQPRLNMPYLKKWRHYNGLENNRNKFLHLLNDFSFQSMNDILKVHINAEPKDISVL